MVLTKMSDRMANSGPIMQGIKRPISDDLNKGKKKKKYFKEKSVTASEINALQETQAVFNSGLFRLQIDELLKEVKLKSSKLKCLETYFESLKAIISTIEGFPNSDVNDQIWLQKTMFQSPFPLENFPDLKFGFVPPTNINLSGLSNLNIQLKHNPILHMLMEIPKELVFKKDYLNQAYHVKRFLYILYIAHSLSEKNNELEMEFSYEYGRLYPVLVLRPTNPKVKVILDAVPPEGVVKLSRCSLLNNNVRPNWLFGKPNNNSESLPPSEVYNNYLAHSLVISSSDMLIKESLSHDNIKDAVYLLKVWLMQREMDNINGITDNILLNLMFYLLKQGKINGMMSSYQIIRVTWNFLSSTNLTTKGISLCINPSFDPDVYHDYYSVVFLDTSGFVNLCSELSQYTYRRIQFEARSALHFLDDPYSNSFNALFLNPVPFLEKFDFLIHIQCDDIPKLMGDDHRNLMVKHGTKTVDGITLVPRMLNFLEKALSNRIVLLDFRDNRNLFWKTNEMPPSTGLDCLIGLIVDPSNFLEHIDKGPEPNTDKAEEFTSFWKDRCSVRRYPDGSICHSVVWSCSSLADKRAVCEKIVKWTLTTHCFLLENNINVIHNQFLKFLKQPYKPSKKNMDENLSRLYSGSGEEAFVLLSQTMDVLRQRLRDLPLALNITSVQGVSPSFRYTELYPPLPIKHVLTEPFHIADRKCLFPSDKNACPTWVEPLDVLLTMEASGKWPDNLEAIKRLKAAFYVKIARLLRRKFKMLAVPSTQCLEILLEGFVFRLRIAYYRELILMKRVVKPDGLISYQNNPESLEFEKQYNELPKISSALHGLQLMYSSFGAACRLAKRWICSQLLSNYFSEVAIELIVAHLYLHPAPFSAPALPQVAFLRFLKLLSKFDWLSSPLVVNLNGDLQRSDVEEVERLFLSSRDILPPLHIITPFNCKSSFWTRDNPSKVILSRVTLLAEAALNCTRKQFLSLEKSDQGEIFRPVYSPYDVIIKLKHDMIPRRYFHIDSKVTVCPFRKVDDRASFMPIAGFCPVDIYVKELMQAYSQYALFFWDRYGGDVIAVLWKPGIVDAINEFKLSHVNGMKPILNSGSIKLKLNVSSILQDFKIIGKGLVEKIENK